METLLVIAVIVTSLGVLAQAGALIGMYLISRRISTKVEGLADEGKRIMAPLEDVTQNLKTTSHDLTEVGKVAREQIRHVEATINETRSVVNQTTADVRDQVYTSVDEIRTAVMRPVREWSAIAHGVAEGIRVFFKRDSRGTRRDEAA